MNEDRYSNGRIEVVSSLVRPIRKLFVLGKDDVDLFWELVEVLSRDIGGILNPILLEPDLFSTWAVELARRNDPDIVLNYSNEDSSRIQSVLHTPVFDAPSMGELRKGAVCYVEAMSNIPGAFASARAEEGTTTVFGAGEIESPLGKFISLHLGLPKMATISDRRMSLFGNIEVKSVEMAQDVVQHVHDKESNFLYSLLGLSMSIERGVLGDSNENTKNYFRNRSTVVLGSHDNLDSLVYFWNARAHYPFSRIVWLPVELADSVLPEVKTYNDLAVFGRLGEDEQSYEGLLRGFNRISTSRHYFPPPSDRWESFMHSASATVAGGRLHLTHPSAKLFSRYGINMNLAFEAWGAPEMNGPRSAECGELFFGPRDTFTPLDFSRVSRRGISKRLRQFELFREADCHVPVELPDEELFLRSLMAERGVELSLGRGAGLADRVLSLLGGVSGINHLADRRVFELVARLAPRRTERITKELEKAIGEHLPGDVDQALGQLDSKIRFLTEAADVGPQELISKVPKDEREDFKAALQQLHDTGVLERGRRLQCPHCSMKLWFSIRDLAEPAKCYCCGGCLHLQIFEDGDSNDRFRLSRLFCQAFDQGLLPLLLTLRALGLPEVRFKRWLINADYTERSTGAQGDLDLIATQGGKLILGEAKAHRGFDVAQLRKLLLIVNTVDADLVVLSTMLDESHERVREAAEVIESDSGSYRAVILGQRAMFSPASDVRSRIWNSSMLSESKVVLPASNS